VSDVRPTLVIADDHESLREEVRFLLSSEFEVLAEARDGESLVEIVRRHTPKALVVDIAMPGMSGIEAVRRLRADGCTAAVVVLTVLEEPEVAEEAESAGALGFVLKKKMGQDLVPALQAALEGRRFVSDRDC